MVAKVSLRHINDPVFTAEPHHYRRNMKIGGRYVFVRDKRFGTEPGFEAHRAWSEPDDLKLMEPSHKFHEEASEFIERKRWSRDFKEAVKQHKAEIVEHLKSIFSKFKKLHYVKLDYEDPVDGVHVGIDFTRAKAPSWMTKIPLLCWIVKKVHQYSTVRTRRQKNLSAVMEALSNEVYIALGMEGQKLKIIRAEYRDHYPKLLLDGTHIEGPGGEKFHTLKGQIVDGVIPGNQLQGEDGKQYPIDTKILGASKIKALLLADRDKVGTDGANIGYVVIDGKAVLMNIDPGKSLEGKPAFSNDDFANQKASCTSSIVKVWLRFKFWIIGQTDRMTHRNLHADLSFDIPTATLIDKFMGDYPNFSIFDSTKLSERVQGMRDIQDNWDAVLAVFDDYLMNFGEDKEDLNFVEEIKDARKRLIDRKEYFEEVLKEQLALSDEELDELRKCDKIS